MPDVKLTLSKDSAMRSLDFNAKANLCCGPFPTSILDGLQVSGKTRKRREKLLTRVKAVEGMVYLL